MRKVSKLGFTLIELLVVISIIGVLSTLVLANVQGVRERGRDAARKSDIKAIQQALEMYKNAQSPITYPPALATLDNSVFMKKVPLDPMVSNSWPDYSYARDATDTLKFTLKACLENGSDQQKDAALDSYCSGKPASYTRTEP